VILALRSDTRAVVLHEDEATLEHLLDAYEQGVDESSAMQLTALLAAVDAERIDELVSSSGAQSQLLRFEDLSAAARHDVITELRTLAGSSTDERVQAASLMQLARVSSAGDMEASLARALGSGAAPLRSAAMTAMIENQIHTPQLKDLLLRMQEDATQPMDARGDAHAILGTLSLDPEQLARNQSASRLLARSENEAQP
jgi:hypothetical protein